MENNIRENPLFQQMSALLRAINLNIVDIKKQVSRHATFVRVIITNSDHSVGIEECTAAHKIMFPRLSLECGRDELDLEVSTPGIQRNFSDIWEFFLFVGKRCRVYDSSRGAWVEGIIEEPSETQIVLRNASFDNSKESFETYHIQYESVHKAKLAYAWEDM